MHTRKETIHFLESQIIEITKSIETLEDKISILEDRVAVKKDFQDTLEETLEKIKALNDDDFK